MPYHVVKQFFYRVMSTILYWFVKPTTVPKDINDLERDPEALTLYVVRNRSQSDTIVTMKEASALGLPDPQAPIEAFGFKTSVVHLQRDRRSDSSSPRWIKSVAEGLLKDPSLKIQVVPVNVFWGRQSDQQQSALQSLFSDAWSIPSRFKKLLIILLNGRFTFVQFSQPIPLHKICEEDTHLERTVRKIYRVLRVRFRRQREAMVGPDLSHRRTIVHRLINQSEVRDIIKSKAKRESLPLSKVQDEAREYALEIVSDFNPRYLRLYDKGLTYLWNKMYEGVEVGGVQQIHQYAGSHEVVYVPCHRSHIDYLLLSYVLFYNGLVPPHIAAGINLNLPIVGPFLRRGGAFFLRRTFKGNKLYSVIFSQYLDFLINNGYPIEYFIEGGRSRTGRLLPPKTGMLSMTVKSFLKNPERKLVFIPVYIGYERLIEASTYVKELRGKTKKKESIFDIPRTLKQLKGSFGKVHVNFGEPLLLGEFLEQHHPEWRTENATEEQTRWLSQLVDRLGTHINRRINAAACATPVSLISLVLLCTPKYAIDERMLIECIKSFQDILNQVPYSNWQHITDQSPHQIVEYAERLNLVKRYKNPLGDVISVDEHNAILFTYFRNNILHLVAMPALLANLFITNRQISRKRLVHVTEVMFRPLRNELFIHWEAEAIEPMVRVHLEAMLRTGLIASSENGKTLYAPQTPSLGYSVLSILALSIKPALQRYYITIATLLKIGSGKATQAQIEDLSQKMAQRLALLHELNAPEFFDKILFKDFMNTMKAHGTITINDQGLVVFGDQIQEIDSEAELILSPSLRQSVHHVAGMSDLLSSEELLEIKD